MKLSKVLIPEVARGSRSYGPVMDKIFKETMPHIHFTDKGIEVETHTEIQRYAFGDINIRNCFIQAKKHVVEKAPTYHLCKGFGEALMGLRDREVISDLLPEHFFAYISLPEGLIGDIQGAYVYVGESNNRTPFTPQGYGQRIVWISYFGSKELAGAIPMGRLNFYLDKPQTITDIVKFYELDVNAPDAQERIALGKLLLNCVLYLNSQDPEILALKPSFGAPHRVQKAHTVKGHLNLCTIRVHAINWDYSKTALYTTEKTFVDGFLAWRRCGPNHSQIKLSWVREHERQVKKRSE